MRLCRMCGTDLEGRRSDARFCGRICAAEASVLRSIIDDPDDGGRHGCVHDWSAKLNTRRRRVVLREDEFSREVGETYTNDEGVVTATAHRMEFK